MYTMGNRIDPFSFRFRVRRKGGTGRCLNPSRIPTEAGRSGSAEHGVIFYPFLWPKISGLQFLFCGLENCKNIS